MNAPMVDQTLNPPAASLRWQQASRILTVLVFGLLAFHLIIYIQYTVGLLRFPFDYDQGEGFELVDTMLFSEGKWPYRSNEVYPFYASNYPPVFHLMLVPFVWLFGEAYWYGRLVGFLSTLVTASTIGFIVRRETQHRQVAIIAGLAFLASNYIYHVGPLFRQHMTMVMFETLAIAILAHVPDTSDRPARRRAMLIGLGLLLLAGYTKQLAYATCIAVFVFLFLRHPRRAIAWGILFGIAAGAIFLAINLATGGEWWNNIIAANVNRYFPKQFWGLFSQWFRLHHVLILMAGLFAAYELYFARLSLYSVWWVGAFANTALSGKWGAGDSYFATAIAATCILSGFFAARTLQGRWTFPANYITDRYRWLRSLETTHRPALMRAARVWIPALYLLYALSVFKFPTDGPVFGPITDALGIKSSYGDRYAFYDSAGWTEGYATIGHVPSQTDIDNGWRIVEIIRASDKPALSEEAGFSIQAGRDVITNPTQLKNLYENNLLDTTALERAIRAHDFSLVVFRAQFYPPTVVAAIYEAYYPAEVIPVNGFEYEIWQPGPPQDERDAVAMALHNRSITIEIDLALSMAQADDWLDHALWYAGWTVADTPPAAVDVPVNCIARQVEHAQEARSAQLTLCPSDDDTASVARAQLQIVTGQ